MLIRRGQYKPGGGAQGKTPSWVGEVLDAVLRPYQRPWVRAMATDSFCALLGSRQIGKDRAAGGVGVGLDMAYGSHREWHCLSASQKHANDLMREIKRFTRMFLDVAQSQGYGVPREVVDNTHTYSLDNNARCVSHAATAKTAQGCRGSGGVLLNEVGIMPGAELIYETVYSIVTGQLDQGRRSTLWMMGNASYVGSFWHKHFTKVQKSKRWWTETISWARAMWQVCRLRGMNKAQTKAWILRRRRERIKDLGENAYAQWYECRWRMSGDCYYAPELVAGSIYDPVLLIDSAGRRLFDFPALDDPGVQQTVGYDPARSRHPAGVGRLLFGRGRRRFLHRPFRMYKVPWERQVDRIDSVARERETLAVVVDKQGVGDVPVELCERRLDCTVIGYPFSVPSRMALAKLSRDALEQGRTLLPNDTNLKIKISSISTTYDKTGRETLVIPESSNSHGDLFVSWMLAEHGAGGEMQRDVSHFAQGSRWSGVYG